MYRAVTLYSIENGIFDGDVIDTEKLKEESRFFICGRGVIVNLEHASDFENEAFCMEDGSRIYVNKELLKSARQAFMEFLLQRGYQS
jgi:two-component system response regulator LytT